MNTEQIGPYPVGTKLYEWKLVHRFSENDFGFLQENRLTGRVGVVELWGVDSTGDKLGILSAEPGDFIVRVLKKDGTPGALYEVLNQWSWWKPEGERVS